MRVLLMHIVDSPEQFGGVERIVLSLAQALHGMDDIEISVAVNPGMLYEKLHSEGIPLYRMPKKRMRDIIAMAGFVLRTVKSLNPDVVHSHHRYTTMWMQLVPRRHYRLLHTFHVEQFTKRWLRLFGDRATAVSQGCKDHFVRYFRLPESFITVIHNGVDVRTAKQHTQGHSRPRNGRIRIVLVGRLTEQKGHEVLLHALVRLPAEARGRIELCFVGEGEKRRQLEKLVDDLGVRDQVEFAGYQEDVFPYICSSDFTVVPSLWEGFGLTIVESFLCGKPVIGSRVGGIPELIEDGKNGIVIPPGDSEALAEAMLSLISNQALIFQYGEAASKKASSFTIKEMIDNYKYLYKKMFPKAI